MVWQPTMRVWAGDEIKVDERELEGDAMEGVESTAAAAAGKSASGSGSQSMSMSATASADGADEES